MRPLLISNTNADAFSNGNPGPTATPATPTPVPTPVCTAHTTSISITNQIPFEQVLQRSDVACGGTGQSFTFRLDTLSAATQLGEGSSGEYFTPSRIYSLPVQSLTYTRQAMGTPGPTPTAPPATPTPTPPVCTLNGFACALDSDCCSNYCRTDLGLPRCDNLGP